MIICSCNVLSDRDVRGVIKLSAHTVSQVYRQLGCSAQCGRCAHTIKKIVQEGKPASLWLSPLEQRRPQMQPKVGAPAGMSSRW